MIDLCISRGVVVTLRAERIDRAELELAEKLRVKIVNLSRLEEAIH